MKKMIAIIMTAVLLAGCAPTAANTDAADKTGKNSTQQKNDAAEKNDTSDDTLEGLNPDKKEATKYTTEANQDVYKLLDFSDEQEIEFAKRGLITAPDSLELKDENGKLVWSQDAYAFLEEDAPDTANPSLWRNAQLNHIYGLFEVMDGIYQVRGYDMTNITFVEGKTGWIVFDPLMSVECSKAALELVNEQLGERPVMGIVISHSHVDHYGGIEGVLTAQEAAKRNVPIIAPDGFEFHAVSESIYAGNAVGRRAGFQYGTILTPGEDGSLSIGIGMGQSKGTTSYITPTDVITKTGQTHVIDGVKMEFQLTPGTEAPAEMNTWFPEKKALWMAENCTGTLHNLYTLRGAQVRDGAAWAQYIMESLTLYGDEADVIFQSHNWPHFGNDAIKKYLLNTATVYKFIHDQTLMYVNQGYTSDEISNMITLPAELEKIWYTRQYYGTVAHDAKAVYQKYMGWYDANPVHLNPITPTESAKKFVEYLGDVDEVLEKAKKDFDAGEYQWVAEITSVLVYADASNKKARYLCADALEQLGYQAESGAWRNAYLSGAQELRNGTTTDESVRATGSSKLMQAMTPDMLLGQIGILLDSNKAQNLNLKFNLNLTDGEKYVVTVNSGVLLYQENAQSEDADATLTLPRAALFSILSKDEEAQKKSIKIDGDKEIIQKLTEHMVTYEHFFNIVEP